MRTPRLIAAKQALFLETYAQCGNISAAARAVGVGRELHYYWLRDPVYKSAFERAHQRALDAAQTILRTVSESAREVSR